MTSLGFESNISADEWPQTPILVRAATVICHENIYKPRNKGAVFSTRKFFRYRQLLAKIPAML